MLCIRLQRTGNKNNPAFRLVATDKRNSAKKNPKEILGHYLPTRDPAVFEFKKDRIEHFLKNGAEPSDTVARLLSRNGVKGLEKYMKRYSKKRKKNAPEEEEKPAPAPVKEAKEEKEAEEPKEEAKEEKEAEESKGEEGDKKEGDA